MKTLLLALSFCFIMIKDNVYTYFCEMFKIKLQKFDKLGI